MPPEGTRHTNFHEIKDFVGPVPSRGEFFNRLPRSRSNSANSMLSKLQERLKQEGLIEV
jgi:hypothetical protein